MRISVKCSRALHILTLLAVFPEQKFTSEKLAKSVGCNPVCIRTLLGLLKEAGFVKVQSGTGGATLIASPEKTTLYDVYAAVDKADLNELISLHPNPAQECPVGRNMYTLLEKPYMQVASAVKEEMKKHTLQQMIDNYYVIEREQKVLK